MVSEVRETDAENGRSEGPQRGKSLLELHRLPRLRRDAPLDGEKDMRRETKDAKQGRKTRDVRRSGRVFRLSSCVLSRLPSNVFRPFYLLSCSAERNRL